MQIKTFIKVYTLFLELEKTNDYGTWVNSCEVDQLYIYKRLNLVIWGHNIADKKADKISG